MGIHVGTRKGSLLTVQTLANALFHHPRPAIFHSDNGREYEAKVFIAMLERYGITISRSRPGSPSEKGTKSRSTTNSRWTLVIQTGSRRSASWSPRLSHALGLQPHANPFSAQDAAVSIEEKMAA